MKNLDEVLRNCGFEKLNDWKGDIIGWQFADDETWIDIVKITETSYHVRIDRSMRFDGISTEHRVVDGAAIVDMLVEEGFLDEEDVLA